MRPLVRPFVFLATLLSLSTFASASVSMERDGLTAEAHGVHLEVRALRDDVVRVRYWRGDTAPEDASWAVLPDARKSSAAVHPIQGKASFETTDVRVEVDPDDLRVTILDKQGHLLQKQAAPIEYKGAGFTLSDEMPLDAHYFGLGDKVGAFDRREQAFTLWNTDAYAWQESTDPLYKAIPFFMTYTAGRAIGTLLDNTWRTHFDFGRTLPNTLVMGASDGPVDYYVLYGPSPKQVLAAYAWLTGPTPLPPLWSLGFQQSRYSYMSQARVEEVAKRLRDDRIPADAIYLDVDYQDRYWPFTVNKKTFPDMAGMVRTLHDEGLHVVAITDLHIANEPHQNYAPYDSGAAENRFVHNPDGSIYTGKVWPGPAVFPDFTQETTRAWWGSLYTDFVGMGFNGFWNDMNEPSVFDSPTKTIPEDVVHRIEEPGFRTRTGTHAEIHNIFGMQNARATEGGLLRLRPNERPFVLTRAAYAGTQRYAATWTGDNNATWNHLRLSTFMLKNLGLSGYSLAGADVGGYAGSPSPELLTKWLEIAAFQPIDRDHAENGTADKEVWVHGPEQEAIRRRFIEERYRLLPYLYTTAEENTRTGLPIVRPLFLEFPDALPDKHPMDTDPLTANEFLFGPALLVAPPPRLEQTVAYQVQFPSAGWFDYWTGKRVDAGTIATAAAGVQPESGAVARVSAVEVTPQLAELPVYVRPGTILPYAPLTQTTQEQPRGPLTLRVYPGPECHGSLYLDDGHTFAYRQGEFLQMHFLCESKPDGTLLVHVGAHEGRYKAWWSEIRVEVYGVPGKSAESKGHRLAMAAEGAASSLTVLDDGHGLDLSIH